MSIRWKFLIVVLVFSVVPLLAVLAVSQVGTLRLGATISELMGNILTHSAGAELTQTAAGSARILRLHLEQIETYLRRSAAGRRPPAEAPAPADPHRFPPTAGSAPPAELTALARPDFLLPTGAGWDHPEGTGDGSRSRVLWGVPFRPAAGHGLQVRLAALAPNAGPKAAPAAILAVDLAGLLNASLLESRWSIRMYAYLVALDAGRCDGAAGLAVLAARDAEDFEAPWRPGEEGETLRRMDDAGRRRICERLARGEPGFLEGQWGGRPAVWAFAPVNGDLALVTITPGMVVDVARDVLAFARWQWVDTAAASLVVLLVLVALAVWRSKAMTASFQEMVQAVTRLGRGDFTSRMNLTTGDEREQVARAFNAMVPQLADRLRIRKALEVAQEIQRTLLPAEDPSLAGFSIAARTVYSDETGGDYYDFYACGEAECGRFGFVVGDVTGHGVGAALLMATARAFVRAVVEEAEELHRRVRRINRLLTADTRQSGNFMSLFFLELDTASRRIQWVRAGHDPALLFDPVRRGFEELGGPGLVLGVDDGFPYEQHTRPFGPPGTILLMGTDGIWEAHDGLGQPFGKERFKAVVETHAGEAAGVIRDAVLEAVREFRGTESIEDDMTLIVIKAL
jgi:sigma-B regulation protein RsbU (phosphoserine phosphatase)